MKFEIKARAYLDGKVLFTADIPDDTEPRFQLKAALEIAVKAGANLAGAYLAGAYLAGANLAGAYLTDAYLAGANLAGANLAGAYLADANLTDAYLAGANLAGANLADAYLAGAISGPASPDEIARLDAVREIVLARPERLDMGSWHSDSWEPEEHTPEEEHKCGSAHCIAGWLQALCTDPELRTKSPEYVGRTLAPASRHMFYTSDAVALQWLKDRGYARQPEPRAA